MDVYFYINFLLLGVRHNIYAFVPLILIEIKILFLGNIFVLEISVHK